MQTDCHMTNPTCQRMFTILKQETIRLDRLVQNVLNVTRLEAGDVSFHPEPISILPVVQQIVAQNQPRLAGRTVQLPLKPGLPLVYADRDWVAEVLANLLGNAAKYSPPGQEISVDARADQTEVTISVRDCGPGLPPSDLERIFDKFYRADNSDSQIAYGYGLGLYICRHLVAAQHGRIWAENHSGGGAVFSFTLPVWQGYDD
jgi:two-component system sensor histidine kinase KdpD